LGMRHEVLLLVASDRVGRGWGCCSWIGSVGIVAAGLQEMLDLRLIGQDQERPPVVAAIELQAEQVLDLAGIQPAGLEPPLCQPVEDPAEVRIRMSLRRRTCWPAGWPW